MKYLRFIPVALGVLFVAVLATQGRLNGALMWVSAILLLAAALLPALYGKGYHHASSRLPYEVAVVFLATLFAVATGIALVRGAGDSTVVESAEAPASSAQVGSSDSADGDASQHAFSQAPSTFEAPQFRGITMGQLMAYLDPSMEQAQQRTAIYVGRDDCASCLSFQQNAASSLGNAGKALLAYSTTPDVGTNALADMLKRTGINSVPVVLVLSGGQVEELIASPSSQIERIVDLAMTEQEADQALRLSGVAADVAGTGASATQCPDGEDCSPQ